MKLLFCPSCSDVRKLCYQKTYCSCKKSWGRYTGDLHAEIGGETIALGIDNKTLALALKAKRLDINDLGENILEFTAFVFRDDTPNITKIKG